LWHWQECILICLLAASLPKTLKPYPIPVGRHCPIFSEETAAATGWIHFLVMDLFVGRWIYWEGQRTGIWTIHSIALCFAGPLGLLSHILTRWISQRFFPRSDSAAEPLGDAAVSSTGTP
jgi:hypothetical protein